MTSNNVIQFPGTVKELDHEGDLTEEVVAQRMDYIDNLIEQYGEDLANRLDKQGFEVGDHQMIRDLSYTLECLRSTLYRQMELIHPFSEHMEEITNAMEIADDFDDDIS